MLPVGTWAAAKEARVAIARKAITTFLILADFSFSKFDPFPWARASARTRPEKPENLGYPVLTSLFVKPLPKDIKRRILSLFL
jgi:hypothetical protein